MGELQLANGAVIEAAPVNASLFQRWIAYVDGSPKTIETYGKSIRRFMRYLADNNIAAPKREDIVQYRQTLLEQYRPTTCQAYLMAVKLFFKWLAQEGIYENIADRVKSARLDLEHKRDYLTTRQVGRVLGKIDQATLKGKRDYAMLALMVTTGIRTIEVARANVEDIRTVGDFPVLYIQGKGHVEKGAYVKLAPHVEDAIQTYFQARFSKTQGAAVAGAPLFGSLSGTNMGGRMDTRSVRRVVKTHFLDAGISSDRLTAHSLRHTFATLNLLNGATVQETQQILRHRNINTTMIYSHALERAKNESEARVAKAIFG